MGDGAFLQNSLILFETESPPRCLLSQVGHWGLAGRSGRCGRAALFLPPRFLIDFKCVYLCPSVVSAPSGSVLTFYVLRFTFYALPWLRAQKTRPCRAHFGAARSHRHSLASPPVGRVGQNAGRQSPNRVSPCSSAEDLRRPTSLLSVQTDCRRQKDSEEGDSHAATQTAGIYFKS